MSALFGGHHIAVVSTSLPAASAAAVASVSSTQPATDASNQQPIPTASPTPPPSIGQPVIERIIERIVPQSNTASVSPTALATVLADFENTINKKISALTPAISNTVPQYVAAGGSGGFSASNAINQLANTAISAPTITGGSISNTSIAGYLPLSGGTLTGGLNGTNLNLSGTLTAGTLNVAGLSSGNAIFAPYFSATSTTATSTFAGNVSVSGGLSAASSTISATTTASGIQGVFGSISTLVANAFNAATATVSNLIATTITGTNATFTSATTTNATSTNLYSANLAAANATLTNATSTNLFGSLAHFTSGLVDSLTATGATITNLAATTITGTNATFTSATTTNATTTNATITNAYATNLAAASAVFTNATSTSFFATTASSTNLFATNASVGALSAGTLSLTGTTGTTTIATGEGFTIGGSQFVVQQGSGNVGIGTTSPQYALSISGSVYNVGKVGIGATPYASTGLYINNSAGPDMVIKAGSLSASRPSILFVPSNNSNVDTQINQSGAFYTNQYLVVSGSYAGTVDANGNYSQSSAGTTGVSDMIDVNADTPFGVVSKAYNSTSPLGTNYLGLDKDGNYTFSVGSDGHMQFGASNTFASMDAGISRLSAGKIAFGNGTSGDFTGTLIAGNIGIGTTSPTTALQVAGVITPNQDNTSSLGNSTYRWSAVYAANGTIQTSDARLKSNITDLTYGLADILKLRPVSFTWTAQPEQGTKLGFIAQEVQQVMPETVTVGDDANHALGLTYTEFIPAIVKSIQELSAKFDTLSTTVSNFAESFTTHHLASDDVITQKLCVTKADGTPVCVTGDQLAAVLAAAGQQSATFSPLSTASSTPTTLTASSTPILITAPVIQINGANPATVSIGASYNDLGATITGPQADLNLGIATFFNGARVDSIQLDTSITSTSTIDYVVTDQFGTAATATRQVIVQ